MKLFILFFILACSSSKEKSSTTEKVGNIFEIDKMNREKRQEKLKKVYKSQIPNIFYTFKGQAVRPCPNFRETLNNKCPPQVYSSAYSSFISECASGETSILLRCSCDTYICSENTGQKLKSTNE
jgi:hypothetical protein